MTKLNTNSKKGFTIIEVVLVLAIAGLIFLMVFVALPALQGSQRDTQRRNDLARVATAINQYQTNNGGKLPNDRGGQILDFVSTSEDQNAPGNFINKYLKADGQGDFVDPTGENYTIHFLQGSGESENDLQSDGNGDTTSFRITVYTRATCGEDENAVPSNNKRDYAIIYKLERSGVYCSDNTEN